MRLVRFCSDKLAVECGNWAGEIEQCSGQSFAV